MTGDMMGVGEGTRSEGEGHAIGKNGMIGTARLGIMGQPEKDGEAVGTVHGPQRCG